MERDRQREIRKIAYGFREKCKVGKYGIIDLFKECERCGYKLIRLPNGANGSLGFVTKRDEEIIIFTNSSCRLSREIFTLAHEIGHILLHISTNSQFIDDKKTIDINIHNEKEIEANYFASCLLLPEEELNRFLEFEIDDYENEGLSSLDIARIMTEFNVSFDMTLYALMNYGKITATTREKLDNSKNINRVGNLLKSVGGNSLLNEVSNTVNIPSEYIKYAIFNYNNNAIPIKTLNKILEYYHLDIEDISDKLLKDEDNGVDDDLLDLIGGIDI